MLVTAADVQGFLDLPRFRTAELGRVVTVRGPGPATTALGDALELFFAAFRADALTRLLRRWGALGPDESAEILGAPLPEQATWTDKVAARWVAGEHRSLSVTLVLELDPVQYGVLRGLAAREPRMVTALSRAASARITVGGLFATSFDALAITVQSVHIGGESFPCTPGQRPPWMSDFLQGLGERFARHEPAEVATLPERALGAEISWDRHAAWRRWQETLAPVLGTVRAARGPGGRPVLLADDQPLRRLGHAALSRAALAADACLTGADILWAETEEDWVEAATEGEGSALEQVWRVCREGTIEVRATHEGGDDLQPPPPLTLRPAEGGGDAS